MSERVFHNASVPRMMSMPLTSSQVLLDVLNRHRSLRTDSWNDRSKDLVYIIEIDRERERERERERLPERTA